MIPLAPLAPLIAEMALKYGPKLARELVALFVKPDPTADDWNALFAKLETYDAKRAAAAAKAGVTLPELPPVDPADAPPAPR